MGIPEQQIIVGYPWINEQFLDLFFPRTRRREVVRVGRMNQGYWVIRTLLVNSVSNITTNGFKKIPSILNL